MTYEENFAEALDTVLGMRRMSENAWPEEQQEAAHAVLTLNAEAYTAGYFDALEDATTLKEGKSPAMRPNPYMNLKAE